MSVVIPSYNYGRFLAASIESALAQTHVPFEVVVIDDGSTDDSVAVASEYAPSVRLIAQPNQGLVAVLNRGLRETSGELVTVLSADDEFRPTYIEALVGALHREPRASYAYCAMEYYGATSGVLRARPFSPALLLAGNYINGSAVFRRVDAAFVGGFNPTFEKIPWEDWDFWLRMLAAGKRGVAISQPLLRYRQHAGGGRNPVSTRATRDAVRLFRTLYPSLYGRRSRLVGEGLLAAALVADRLRCTRCLRLLDRMWGFDPGGRLAGWTRLGL